LTTKANGAILKGQFYLHIFLPKEANMITQASKSDYPVPDRIPPGKKIRLARLARYMSTRQLGEAVGKTYGWVNQIESGELHIKVDMYERIQAALGYNFNSPEAEAAFAFFLNGNDPTQS
jgi:hypothetical protein